MAQAGATLANRGTIPVNKPETPCWRYISSSIDRVVSSLNLEFVEPFAK